MAAFSILPLQVAAESSLFAAFAMTKAQEASATPTDSGLVIRDEATGEWKQLGPKILFMNSVAVDPSDPQTVFLACGNGIVRSQDGGENWRMTTGWRESDINRIVVDPTDGSNIYAASYWGIHVSRDGGDHWQAANDGLANPYSLSIVVDHRDPARILIGNEDGIYVSHNRAQSWVRIPSSPKVVVPDIARGRADPDRWLAATEGAGIYISHDDGVSWQPTAPELSGANIYAVGIDSRNSDRLLAGGWGVGLHVSTDGGNRWQAIGDGLPSQQVTAVTFDPNVEGRIWAATFEEGTYYTDDLGATWRHEEILYGAYVYNLDFVEF